MALETLSLDAVAYVHRLNGSPRVDRNASNDTNVLYHVF